MNSELVGNLAVVVAIPVIMARIVIIWVYGERTWRMFVTGILPTLALLVLVVRVAIQRNFVGWISPQDWISVATWGFIVVTQAVAAIVQYWPEKLFRRQRGTS